MKVLLWYAFMAAVWITGICLVMVYGWGLSAKSWPAVIIGYVLVNFSWPFMVWARIKIIKKWEGKNVE